MRITELRQGMEMHWLSVDDENILTYLFTHKSFMYTSETALFSIKEY